jgi:hypothetical protein
MNSESLKKLKKDELKSLCKEKGLKVSGNKKELFERLLMLNVQLDKNFTNETKTKKKKKDCVEIGCTTTAVYGYDKCQKHGGGKRCSIPMCKRGVVYGYDKCQKHGGGKECIEPECVTIAVIGYDKCRKHGGGRRCSELGCTTGVVNGYDRCYKHGGGKKLCSEHDCKTNAIRGSNKCIRHGGYKRCIEPECTTGAVLGYDKCKAHGGGRRCSENGCTKSARAKIDKCIEHGGGLRCPNCIDWPDSRGGNPDYDGYCATCFKRLFPCDPRSRVIHEHTKEIRVRNAIQERAENDPQFLGFIHNKPLYTGNCDCTHRRRIDHRKLIGNTILAIETDEYAHQDYDEKDEEIRYDDLYMIHSGKWIFIRFNPDKTRNCRVDLEDRIPVLLDEIETHIERIYREENTELVEIHKLYYD